jgi:hypothetical protein
LPRVLPVLHTELRVGLDTERIPKIKFPIQTGRAGRREMI